MDKRGLSNAELARQLKTHPSNVGKLLKGEHFPSAETLSKLTELFGIPLCELLCGPPPTKRKKK